jgi:CubicO group peptidase (beta-lactamase class C family)
VPLTYTWRPATSARENPKTASYGDPDEIRRRSTRLVSPRVQALEQIEQWGAENAAAGVVDRDGIVAWRGDEGHEFRWASVTKPVVALAVLVAVEEGVVDLDEPAGPPGSTVRHLLAHASGLPFEGTTPIAEPGVRRIYSNTGFETLADHLEGRADMPFVEYLTGAVLAPLELDCELRGTAAAGLYGTLLDLLDVARELLVPTLVAPETLAEATTVAFPGLVGVLPDFGRMEPNDWGLGIEIRDHKSPHWTGHTNSPATYGHFGGSGTFLWVDPDAQVAVGCLTDRETSSGNGWIQEAWPRFSDAVLSEAASEQP